MYQLKLWFKRLIRYLDYGRNIFKLPSEKTVIETLPEANGIIDFLHKLAEHFTFNFYYASDGDLDFAKHPLIFARDKRGDCDDFSLFALWALRIKFPEAESYLATCFHDNEGHAVCIVMYGGNYYHISNWGFYGGFNTLDALAASIFRDWKRFYLLNYNFTIIKQLQNEAK